MLFGIGVVVLLLVSIILCLLVLLQSDKGGGISGAFGGGLSNANSVLGTRESANILTRGTTIFAVSYMVLCVLLSLFLSKTGGKQESMLQQRAEQKEEYAPASILDQTQMPQAPAQQGVPGGAQGPGQQTGPAGAQPPPQGAPGTAGPGTTRQRRPGQQQGQAAPQTSPALPLPPSQEDEAAPQ
jgi:preprotein translocase subunit SecG